MKTIPISRFRRDCVDLLSAATNDSSPLVVTRRGKPVAQVLPFPAGVAIAAVAQEPAGLLKDRMEFAGEASWTHASGWHAQR